MTAYIPEIHETEFELFQILAPDNDPFPQCFSEWQSLRARDAAVARSLGNQAKSVPILFAEFKTSMTHNGMPRPGLADLNVYVRERESRFHFV